MDQIQQAVNILKKGGVVVYPTDTAYGLAVDATNVAAVKRLYKLKGRDFNKPTHIIFPNVAWLKKNVVLDKTSLKIMEKFLPGPLTVVAELKSKNAGLRKIASKSGIGLRYPKHPVAIKLAVSLNKPITTTSANLSNQPTTYSIFEVKKQFANSKIKPDLYLDGGKLKKIKPSTIVSVDDNNVTIIREGPISEKQIRKVISKK